MSNVLPCPLCGGEALISCHEYESHFRAFVECRKCSCITSEIHQSKSTAIKHTVNKWNTRIGQDYFSELVNQSRTAARKAMEKFPQPNYVALKIAEEAGEVVRACVHYAEKRMEWPEVEGEIIQLLAMIYRLVNEGDHVNGVHPPIPAQTGKKQ